MTGVYVCGLEDFFPLHFAIFLYRFFVSCVEHYFQIKVGAQSVGLSLGEDGRVFNIIIV